MPFDDDRVMVVVQEPRQSQGHPWMWLGVGTGVVVGLLYFMRGQKGWSGGGGTGLFGGRGTTPTAPLIDRGTAPPMLEPPQPPLKRDDVMLKFIMTAPTGDAPSQPISFRGSDSKTYSIDDLIARVKAGGRLDVTLLVAGNVIQGAWDSAKATINAAWIDIIRETVIAPQTPKIAGYSRGAYR